MGRHSKGSSVSITPQELAALARDLARGDNEVDWRSSSSRCYYAAYHLASSHAEKCPHTDNASTGSHAQLARRFQLQGSKDARVIAEALTLMKRQRHAADYMINTPFAHKDVEDQLSKFTHLARRIVSFSVQG